MSPGGLSTKGYYDDLLGVVPRENSASEATVDEAKKRKATRMAQLQRDIVDTEKRLAEMKAELEEWKKL